MNACKLMLKLSGENGGLLSSLSDVFSGGSSTRTQAPLTYAKQAPKATGPRPPLSQRVPKTTPHSQLSDYTKGVIQNARADVKSRAKDITGVSQLGASQATSGGAESSNDLIQALQAANIGNEKVNLNTLYPAGGQ